MSQPRGAVMWYCGRHVPEKHESDGEVGAAAIELKELHDVDELLDSNDEEDVSSLGIVVSVSG